MKHDRRNFLKLSTTAISGVALAGMGLSKEAMAAEKTSDAKPLIFLISQKGNGKPGHP